MKIKLLLSVILLTGLIVLGQLEIIDSLGRKVTISDNVEKVVAAGPGALRIVVYLDSTDKIVGVEDFERMRPYGRPYILAHLELKDLPSIGPGGPGKLPDLEAILKLKPDVVFITYVDKRTADSIQDKLNIPVVVLSYGTLKTFEDEFLFDSLRLAGKILGKTDRAQEVINFIMNVQRDLEKRVADSKRSTAYVGGIGYRGAHGIDSTKPDYPIFNVLKIENVAKDINQEHAFIDRERLLLWQPEFVFIDEGGLNLVVEDYTKNPEFYEFLEAFKTGKVYGLLPYNYYTTNIGTALADAYFVGKIVYPEKFKDIVPEKKADEIYEFLVGKAVYNEMKKQFGGFGKLNLKERSIVPVR
ncbi:MAG: iron complex transport system substrate-binding protein [Thermotogaceae bacterium]|nr:iron complex transport system substrate-binding protein [Thermotogaceae bacterium]